VAPRGDKAGFDSQAIVLIMLADHHRIEPSSRMGTGITMDAGIMQYHVAISEHRQDGRAGTGITVRTGP
jgi:hypothetical protein